MCMPCFLGCLVDGARARSLPSWRRSRPNAFRILHASKWKSPLSLGGTEVLVNGEPAPLLFASAGQINFILPFTLAHASKSPFSPASREISHRRSPPVHNFFERDFPCKLYRLSSCRTER